MDRAGSDSSESRSLVGKRRVGCVSTTSNRLPVTLLVLLLLVAPSVGFAEWPAWIDNEKIRGTMDFVDVDKRAHFAKLADSGINALMLSCAKLDVDTPDRLALLKKQAGWYADLGLHVFVTTRLCGHKPESKYLIPDGRRYVNNNGLVLKKTPCPVDPAFWESVIVRRGQLVAQLSLNHSSIDGWALDPEMYAANQTDFPGHCYCEDCLGEFLQDRGLPAQKRSTTRRSVAAWLGQQQLAEPYEQWQSRQVEALARKAERAMHKINPDLLIGVFVLDVDKWYYNAWARGFGTAKMPVIAFSESTYSTGATKYLTQTNERFKQIGAHAVLCPGLYLRKFPAREVASQLFHMSQDTAGYWLFTTYGLHLKSEEEFTNDYSWTSRQKTEFLDAFRLTGKELDRQAAEGKAFVAKLKLLNPRVAVEGFEPEAGAVGTLRPIDPKGQTVRPDQEPTHLRYEAVFYASAAAGDDIKATLTAYFEGLNDHAPSYILIAPGGEILTEGTVPLKGPAVELKVTATETGLYRLAMRAKGNLFSVALDMPHAVQSVGDTVSVVKHAQKMYFYVPKGCAEFFVKVATPYVAEQARVIVWDPTGKETANEQTIELTAAKAIVTTTPKQRGKVWSFQIVAADRPTFYSANLLWDPRLPPYLAESPEALLVPVEE